MSLFDQKREKDNLWEEVRNLSKKEQWDAAIEALKKLVEIDSRDQRAWLRLGEIYQRIDKKASAILCFLKAAEEYGKDGFYPKAVAVLKQVLLLDDTRLDVRENMALLYDKLNLPEEAEKQRAFSKSAEDVKEKAVLDFIKGKYEAAGKGNEQALKFCKNLCIVVLESTEIQIKEMVGNARRLPAKPKSKKKKKGKK